MKRKLLSMLVLLMTAVSVAWGQEESYLYLEVNSGNNTAVLKYGQVPDNTPYYVGGDNNVWSGDPAKSSVTTITVDASCHDYAGTTLHEFFKNFTALTTINDLEYLNTANVENMSSMFLVCSSLASLDLSGWNTAKVTKMSDMFLGCSKLASLDLSGWNTGSVTDMSFMFNFCSSLASLDLSGWNTANVTNMSGMFLGCSQLENICVGNGWSTGEVTESESSNMFGGCTSLPNFNPEEVDKNRAYVGAGGYLTSWKQENLYLYLKVNSDNKAVLRYGQVPADTPYYIDSQWNVDGGAYELSSVMAITVEASCQHFAGTNLSNLFSEFPALTTINDLENLNTAKVTNMEEMFKDCSSLPSLDLSGWNTAEVTNMKEMFNGCSKLENIYVGDGWSTENVTEPESSKDMFSGCTKLPNFNSTVVDKTHANTGAGGYLTSWTQENLRLYLKVNLEDNTAVLRYGQVPANTPYYDGNNQWVGDGTDAAKNRVTDITVAESCKHFAGKSLYNLFSGFKALTTIYDLENIYTANVTDMEEMFKDCSSLPSLDLSGWNTANVTYMSYMFLGCSSLASLDLSGWNTGNVVLMNDMFNGCSSLATLDLSGWNTGNVVLMNDMFNGCSSLATLTFGEGWDTSSVTNMSYMFNGCSSLETLDLSGWNTDKVTDMSYMFRYCSSLASLTFGEGWNTGSVTDMNGMFEGCSSLPSLDLSGWNTDKVTHMLNMFDSCSQLVTLDLSSWNTGSVTNMRSMFNGCSGLASLTFGEGWNTANVENMSFMFRDCSSLETLDLSGWDTAKVTDMSNMFSGCSQLENIYVGDGWSTEKVTSSNDMFSGCTSLPNWNENATDATKAYVGDGGYLTSSNLYLEVDPQNNTLAVLRYGQVPADTPYYVGGDDNVWSDDSAMSGVKTITVAESCKNFAGESLYSFFNGFSALMTINGLGNLNTAKVTDMCGMFLGCSSLESLDVSGWNTAKVTDMSGMFYNCKNLATLTFGDNWSTAGVNGMVSMFNGCSKLASLDLSSWNTGSVTNMSLMFLGCSSLASLDLSGWNTGSVTDMNDMFNSCPNLKNIYVGDGWSTDKVTSSDDMFKGCTKLPNFNSAVVDKTHANTGAGGYLTATTYNVQAHEGAQGEYWATFYSEISNYQAPEGTQVFTVILNGTSITMKEIGDGIVKSGQGVVLKASTADGVNLTPTNKTATGDFTGNSLQGTATSITNPGNAYVLNYKEGTGAGFYKLSSTGTIGANKAYLTYDAQEGPVGAPAFFSFDNTTGIVEMRNEGNEGNGGNGENAIWYDLNGRRLQGKPAQKGLYIVNGKKVIIK